MILQKLIDYAATLDLPPAMYEPLAIKYVFEMDMNGNLTGTAILDGGRKNNDPGKELIVPAISKASGISARLLVDNGEYVCGVRKPPKKEETEEKRIESEAKVSKRHDAFILLLNKCAEETGSEAVRAILNFYGKTDYQDRFINDQINPSVNVSFRVNGKYPFNEPAVQEFWQDHTKLDSDKETDLKCHICGVNPAEEKMPGKIKHIPDGQTSGMALISANASAFESFGLRRSKVAPTCRDCAERFTFALNHLLKNEDSRLTVGKQVYVFWCKEKDFYPAKILHDPNDYFDGPDLAAPDDPAKIRALFMAAFGGRTDTRETEAELFYAAAFSAAGGRVVVRDWLEMTIPVVKANLANFFTCCYHKYQQRPYGIYALAAATVYDAKKDLPARTLTQLLNAALKGTCLPEDLLYQAIKRAKAEQAMTAPRAALIKLYYLSNSKYKETDMYQLNLSNQEPAYLCGRLLAVLEAIQSTALGNPSATIVDRYYGTASTAPATVFSTLLTGARHHLSKLRKEKPGLNILMEKQLQEITGRLTAFPRVLSLEEQGKFALGYYHQKQERYQKHETKEEK